MTALTYEGLPWCRGMYPTVGGSDEFIRLFLFRKAVTPEELRALHGKLSGCRDEGEVISLEVACVPLLSGAFCCQVSQSQSQ